MEPAASVSVGNPTSDPAIPTFHRAQSVRPAYITWLLRMAWRMSGASVVVGVMPAYWTMLDVLNDQAGLETTLIWKPDGSRDAQVTARSSTTGTRPTIRSQALEVLGCAVTLIIRA